MKTIEDENSILNLPLTGTVVGGNISDEETTPIKNPTLRASAYLGKCENESKMSAYQTKDINRDLLIMNG